MTANKVSIADEFLDAPVSDKVCENTNERLLDMIDGRTYTDILLRNNILEDGANMNIAMDELLSLYEKLFEYGMFLSGFQFVGLIIDNKPSGLREEIAYFFLGLGFFTSIFAALVAFISLEFFKSMKNEDPELVITGCMKYKKFFRLADSILFLDTGLFLLSLNVMVYSLLRSYLAITLNVIAGLLTIFLLSCHYIIVLRRQIYTLKDGKVLRRNIYTDKFR
eukprot:gene820-10561_t